MIKMLSEKEFEKYKEYIIMTGIKGMKMRKRLSKEQNKIVIRLLEKLNKQCDKKLAKYDKKSERETLDIMYR